MKNATSRSGSVLLIVMCFVVVAGALVGSILGKITAEARLIQRQERLEHALNVAEAGLEHAAVLLARTEGYSATNNLTGHLDGQRHRYSVSFNQVGFRTWEVRSIGTSGQGADQVQREVSVDEMFVPTFAEFGWWTRVNGNIYFFYGDTLYGHIHTDDQLRFLTQNGLGPTFNDLLTSKASNYYLNNRSGSSGTATDPSAAAAAGCSFARGLHLGEGHGSMADVPWSDRKFRAQDAGYGHGIYLEGPTQIQFDGSRMMVSNSLAGLNYDPVDIGSETLVYVADVPGDADQTGKLDLLGGTVDGQLTIFTEDDMRIHDDILYANDPRDDNLDPAARDFLEKSDDRLGLVSMSDIVMDANCSDNLDIFAAMMATGARPGAGLGEFKFENWIYGPLKGTLTVYGSIVQDTRGPVGSVHGDGSVHGFYKNYHWDDRFGDAAPPHFPTLQEEIEYKGWKEQAPTI